MSGKRCLWRARDAGIVLPMTLGERHVRTGSPARALARAGVLVLGFLAVLLSLSAFVGSVVAWGAVSEVPVTGGVSGVSATGGMLHGTLNPGAGGEPGSYQFDFAPSKSLSTFSAGRSKSCSGTMSLKSSG
jgi:hypothetical protein